MLGKKEAPKGKITLRDTEEKVGILDIRKITPGQDKQKEQQKQYFNKSLDRRSQRRFWSPPVATLFQQACGAQVTVMQRAWDDFETLSRSR